MLDTTSVELCAQCLADAAAHGGVDGDLTLSATALARDLRDAQCDDAAELLDAAWRLAIASLDHSDLDARSFANTLRRLAILRDRTHAVLGACDHEVVRTSAS